MGIVKNTNTAWAWDTIGSAMDSPLKPESEMNTANAKAEEPDNVSSAIATDLVEEDAVSIKSLTINESPGPETGEDESVIEPSTVTPQLASPLEPKSDSNLNMEIGTSETTEPEPCSSSSMSSLKKKVNSCHRRNYRKSNQGTLSEDSNDASVCGIEMVETLKARMRSNESKRHSEEDTSEENDLPQTKYLKQDEGAQEGPEVGSPSKRHPESVPEDPHSDPNPQHSSATSTASSSAGGDSDLHDFSDADRASDHEHRTDDDEDDADSHVESVELGDHDTSSDSDSSHGIVFEDEGSSSSSSSDNFLEDLDERCKSNISLFLLLLC